MFAHSTTATTAMLSLAISVNAAGVAHVINECGIPVYFASVAQNVHASMAPLPASGYSEAYSKPNVGVSIKLSTSATGSVSQFEFTWASNNINYDISNIDGNPFAEGGMILTPSMTGVPGYPSCQVVNCPANQSSCAAAYNQPDDVRTMVCPDASDLVMTLCPDGPMTWRIPSSENMAHRAHARQFA